MMIFLMGVLATWRITALLVYGRYGEPIRHKAKAHMLDEAGYSISAAGRILQCFWCTSLIVAIFFSCVAIRNHWPSLILYWPAMSGGAVLLNHLCRINLYAERR